MKEQNFRVVVAVVVSLLFVFLSLPLRLLLFFFSFFFFFAFVVVCCFPQSSFHSLPSSSQLFISLERKRSKHPHLLPTFKDVCLPKPAPGYRHGIPACPNLQSASSGHCRARVPGTASLPSPAYVHSSHHHHHYQCNRQQRWHRRRRNGEWVLFACARRSFPLSLCLIRSCSENLPQLFLRLLRHQWVVAVVFVLFCMHGSVPMYFHVERTLHVLNHSLYLSIPVPSIFSRPAQRSSWSWASSSSQCGGSRAAPSADPVSTPLLASWTLYRLSSVWSGLCGSRSLFGIPSPSLPPTHIGKVCDVYGLHCPLWPGLSDVNSCFNFLF